MNRFRVIGILLILLAAAGIFLAPKFIKKPPPEPLPSREEVTVTVIEGWTIVDIQKELERLEIDVLPSDFLAERFADEFPFLKGLATSTSLEGYLFPDTYRVWKDELPDGLVRKQLQEFSEKTAGFKEAAVADRRSVHEIVILASIIEREVKHNEDRPVVAGIFMNRLRLGMRLQSDATLNYVINSGRSRLTLKETEMDSPYNTYKYAGLPPGPISNPGKASLEAARTYERNNYYYFLTDEEGKAYFAKTLEQHSANRLKAFGN